MPRHDTPQQSKRLPPILPVLDPELSAREPVEVLAALAEGGAAWIEYRDKRADDRRFWTRARELQERAVALGVTLLINDRVDVALAVGAAGVHLGQEDLPVEVARRLLGSEAVVGLSVGDVEEAVAARELAVDYLAIGPVYATASKPDAGPPVGLERVAELRGRCRLPLVAIGGINSENAAAVTAAGADCVAAISALILDDDIAGATDRLRRAAERGLARRALTPPEPEP